MKIIVAFLTAVFAVQSCWAWSEGGHHLIAVLAFEELMPAEQRRAKEIKDDPKIWTSAHSAAAAANGLSPLLWLGESAELARRRVYTKEILPVIEKAAKDEKIEPINLSEEYLKAAGRTAQFRAAFAAMRLAEILRQGIGDGRK